MPGTVPIQSMYNSDSLYQPPEMKERKDLTGEQSLLSAMNRFVQAVNEMDETVMIPSKLMDMPASNQNGENNNAVVSVNNFTMAKKTPGDLYSFYTMLNAIKAELVRGPKSEEDLAEEENDSEKTEADELAKKNAAIFRHHLKGLFSVLRQLTDTADQLKSQYQDEIGEYNSRSKLSSFI